MKQPVSLTGFAVLTLLACGNPFKAPQKPENVTHSVVQGPEAKPPAKAPDGGRSVILGWYCPRQGAGRPAVRALFARDPSWSSELAPQNRAIASRRVKRFTVLAWLGHAAGSMIVMGSAQDSGGKMATGSYVGASVCQPKSVSGTEELPDEDPVCRALSDGCALALGELEASSGFGARPYEEDPERLDLFRGSACESGDILRLDTDGDGKVEFFSIADLRTPGSPPVELPLATESGPPCVPSFAAAVPDHPDLVRMAVLDVDGDGRSEVLYRRNGNEFLLYGAPRSPARLELLGRQVLTLVP